MNRRQRKKLLADLTREQRGRCIYCSCVTVMPEATDGLVLPTTATLDHRVPISKGGSDAAGNLVMACHRCNSHRGNTVGRAGPTPDEVIELHDQSEAEHMRGWLHPLQSTLNNTAVINPVERKLAIERAYFEWERRLLGRERPRLQQSIQECGLYLRDRAVAACWSFHPEVPVPSLLDGRIGGESGVSPAVGILAGSERECPC